MTWEQLKQELSLEIFTLLGSHMKDRDADTIMLDIMPVIERYKDLIPHDVEQRRLSEEPQS